MQLWVPPDKRCHAGSSRLHSCKSGDALGMVHAGSYRVGSERQPPSVTTRSSMSMCTLQATAFETKVSCTGG